MFKPIRQLIKQTKLATPQSLKALLMMLIISLLAFIPTTAYAAGTIPVDTTADELGGNAASCSLREAIESANGDTDIDGCVRTGTAPYTINLAAGTYELTLAGMSEEANTTGDLDILASVEIVGAGADQSIIQAGAAAGAGIDRVLHISGTVEVSITGVTIQNGLTEVDGNGGGIANVGGAALTITDSTIANNIALGDGPGEGGGGIYNGPSSTLSLVNATISGNSAVTSLGNGGGIFNDAGATLAISGGTITGNEAARAGGGVENNSGTVTFTDVTVDGNTTGINGGGLHISGTGITTFTNGTASNNVAGKEGGGLWNSAGGTLNVVGTTLDNNTASGDDADQGGGGLFNDGGLMTVTSATLTNNVANGASGSGGGILNLLGELVVTDSDISNNSATRAGGAIEDNGGDGDSIVTISNTKLNNNSTGSAPGNGGGLHITGEGEVTIIGGEVFSNTASAEGGGLWNSAVGSLTITNTVVSGNTASGADADQGGGGLFNDGGVMTVSGAIITNNAADGAAGSGGGILNLGGQLDVRGGEISGNSALRAGGGIEDNATPADTEVTIMQVLFKENSTGAAPGNGGALHITGPGDVIITESTVTGNTASAEGGGLWNSAVGSLNVMRSTIDNNSAAGTSAENGGGGLYNDGGFMTVIASTISSNSAPTDGGGIKNVGTLQLYNVTIFENSSANGVGGVANMGGTVDTSNSIIAHTTGTGADCGGFTVTGSNLDSDGTCGASITADPLLNELFNNGGSTATHWPSDTSPAFAAGNVDDCAAEPVDSIDQMGVPIRATACSLGAVSATAPTALNVVAEPIQEETIFLFLPFMR